MKIEFCKNARGDSPVLKFIQRLPKKHRKKISDKINRLQRHGLQKSIQIQLVKNFNKPKKYKGIYELIIDYDNTFYRIFFTMIKNVCWFMHAFKKKSDKTPLKELNKALSIKKQINFNKRNYEF